MRRSPGYWGCAIDFGETHDAQYARGHLITTASATENVDNKNNSSPNTFRYHVPLALAPNSPNIVQFCSSNPTSRSSLVYLIALLVL